MRIGGSQFRDGYRFWYRCHGRIWKFTAEERLALKKFPVCPECDATTDSGGRIVFKARGK